MTKPTGNEAGRPREFDMTEYVSGRVDYADWRVAETNQRQADCNAAGVYSKSSYLRAAIRILNQLLASPSRQNVLDWIALPEHQGNDKKIGLWFRAWDEEDVKHRKNGDYVTIEGRFQELTETKPWIKL